MVLIAAGLIASETHLVWLTVSALVKRLCLAEFWSEALYEAPEGFWLVMAFNLFLIGFWLISAVIIEAYCRAEEKRWQETPPTTTR